MVALEGKKAGRQKRGQGEGHFEPLPDGRVRWRVMVTTMAGERRHPSGTARNLTEARKAVRAVREAARNEALPPREKVTIEQLVTTYIAHSTPRLKWRTLENYRALLQRNIMPTLGTLKAQGVNAARLREFYDSLREAGQGDSVRRQVHNLLHAAYRQGLADSIVTVNPAARVKPIYTERGNAGRPTSYTPEEAAKFYVAARADRWGWPLLFMIATGLRPGETLALKWSNVTFNRDGTVRVRVEGTRSVSGGKVYEDTPKTDQGRREIDVKGDAAVMLREVKANGEREKDARLVHNGRLYEDTGYVFTSRAGTPYRPDNLRRPMTRLCRQAGIRVLTPHKLRHTFTSVLGASGTSLEVMAAQLGHKNATITRNFYRDVFVSERKNLTYDPVTGTEKAATSAPRRLVVKVRQVRARMKDSA